jgi:hypothetical protein
MGEASAHSGELLGLSGGDASRIGPRAPVRPALQHAMLRSVVLRDHKVRPALEFRELVRDLFDLHKVRIQGWGHVPGQRSYFLMTRFKCT